MSADRIQMAKVLSHRGRVKYMKHVANQVDRRSSTILDLGCGVGMLAPLLRSRAPQANIVGLDMSQFLLGEMRTRNPGSNVETLQGRMPEIPIQTNSIDAIVAVQALHEVFHFMGSSQLKQTLDVAHSLLREGGVFVAMDHQNPGEGLARVKMSEKSLEKLTYFRDRFQPRRIQYTDMPGGDLEMSLRDLYDFVTKIWSFGTDLEEEEMNETHTPFTAEEIASKFLEAGFTIEHLQNLNPIEQRLKPFGIKVLDEFDLPGRYFLLKARK